MELREYLRVLRRQWILIALIALLGLGAAVLVTALTPKSYTAQAKAFVSVPVNAPNENGTSALAEASAFAQARVKSYVGLSDSELVLQPVITQLRLNTTVSKLAGKVVATNPVATVLLDISATDKNRVKAAQIANAVASKMATVIEGLEKTRNSSQSQVIVTITRPATTPSTPVSPRPGLNYALGLVIGLALGVAVAMLRERMDSSVKSSEQVRAISGSSPLGTVNYSSEIAKTPLVSLNPRAPLAEAYRTIRTRLQFVDVDDPPRRIVVTSAGQGEGKTVGACNLAITIANTGARVCLVEADLRRPRVSRYLGIEGSVGLTNVLAGQRRLDELLVPWHDGLLTVLSAGTSPPDPSELLGSQHMHTLMEDLSLRFDFVIIDAPPLLPVTDAAVIAQAADGAVVVVRHGQTRRDDLSRSVDILRQANARLLGTVITFAPGGDGKLGYEYGYGYTEDNPSGTTTGSDPGSGPARTPASAGRGPGGTD